MEIQEAALKNDDRQNKISDVCICGVLNSNKEPIGWVTMLTTQALEGPNATSEIL